MSNTEDYRDANNDGTNDKDENTKRRQTMYKGMEWGHTLMQDLFSNPGTAEDEGRAAMRNAFQFDVGSKFINTQLGMAQSEFNLAQNKEGMRYANYLDRQTGQETRNHIFGLNMKTMDKQFELNDEFANRDFSRNLGMLSATGEQTRKNYAAEGQQQRLGIITSGEQQRQNIKATGIENRAQAVTEGEQKRLNIGKTAEEERSTMSHSDNIAAGREKRQNAAARAAARSY